jgi:hypothetical protein
MKQDLINYDGFPRSILKSQALIGFGTALCESLESYFERLLAAHDIQRTHLECLVKGDLATDKTAKALVEPVRLDGPSATARAFAVRLAELTQQPDVRHLGLGWLNEILASADALRHRAAWCPLCVRDTRLERRVAHAPLLWSVKSVEACAIHRVVLVSSCWNCNAVLGARSGLRFPFLNCAKCMVPLDKANTGDAQSETLANENQLAATEQVGALIAKLQRRIADEPLTRPDMRRIIHSAVDRGVCSGTMELTRRAQISKSTLSALLHGRKVGLDTWVRIALAADVALAGMFAPDLWEEGVFGKCVSWRSAQSKDRQRPAVDWEWVQRDALRRIEGPDAVSVYELSRTLETDPQHLKRKLGPLAARLNEAAAMQRRRDQTRRVSSLAQRIREKAAEMREAGRRVSARSVARHLDQKRMSITFVLAYREAAADIGQAPILGRARMKDLRS